MDRPQRAFDARINRTDDGQLLLIHGTDAFELGHVEEFIWQRCDGTRTVDTIAREVASHYRIGADRAGADTGKLVRQFRRAGLLE